MKKNGIDASRHQGTIDWQEVKKSGVEFAILRAGYGKYTTQADQCFEENYSGCQAAGIPCGVYWYSYAISAAEAEQEAAACLEVIRGKQFAYPVYFDIEEASQFALGETKCSEIAKAFLDAVEKAGYWVGIYSSKSNLEAYISKTLRKRYAVWVAHYQVSQTDYSGDYGIWQKSDNGRISGISGDVDLDECYIDYPALIQAKGLNGFSPVSDSETEQTPDKSISELAQEVLAGVWGNGSERKERLTAAGYDYAEVQTEVNKRIEAAKTLYTVAPGDTLTAIAKKYGTSVQSILQANQDTYPSMTEDFIMAGWKLKV